MPTKKHNIDSLFEKAKSDFEKLDDFEKDAFNGLENYSSIKNVKELQNNLKRRFEKEILKKSKKKPQTFFWLAAATLAFLIGLSVFFIFTSDQNFSKSKKLAINTPKENVNFNHTNISIDTTELTKVITTSSNSNSVTNDASENKAASKILKKTIAQKENEKPDKKIQSSLNNKLKVSEKEIPTEGQVMTAFNEENKSSTNSLNAFEKENEKNNNITENDIAFVTKNNKVIMERPSVNSPENKSEQLRSENLYKSKETRKVEADEFVNCYYKGGEAEIVKDINNKLNSKKSNLKFDVIIFINQNKLVENVEFINSYSLTEIEKKQIIAVIKSLDKFDFFMPPTTKNSFKYKLSFNP
jgi:hypothetical protein